jgi:hypothetical protein
MEKKRKIASAWILMTGILILILGIIHNVATPFIMNGFEQLPDDKFMVFVFMFVATGTATIFFGLITIVCATKFDNGNKTAYSVLMLSGFFVIILGAGAFASMPSNPFAYATLAIAFLNIIPMFIFSKSLRFEQALEETDKNNN